MAARPAQLAASRSMAATASLGPNSVGLGSDIQSH